MGYTLRKAVASEAKPLVGLYSESGAGKTKSALLLACGYVGGDMSKVAMIETEAGRGEAYADEPQIGGYQIISMREDFSPHEYGQAITAAERAGVQALIIDSASHEWEGVGGVLDMAARNQAAGKKGQVVWQKPKMDHQREFMLRITQTPIPLVIVCMRAKYPMIEVKKANGEKEWQRSKEMTPKQSDDILFEMFIHGWIDHERHAFHCTKYTIDSLRDVLIDGEPIDVATGQRLAEWARVRSASAPAPRVPAAGAVLIDDAQVAYLETQCRDHGIAYERLKKKANVDAIAHIEAKDFERAKAWLNTVIARSTGEQQ